MEIVPSRIAAAITKRHSSLIVLLLSLSRGSGRLSRLRGFSPACGIETPPVSWLGGNPSGNQGLARPSHPGIESPDSLRGPVACAPKFSALQSRGGDGFL